MNQKEIFIAGLITADHILIKNRENWRYIGSIGGGSAANVYFALKTFNLPVKLIGAVGKKNPSIFKIALDDLISNSRTKNLIHISNNSETREYYHLIEKINNHWTHKFSSSSPISNRKQTYSVQFRKSYFYKEFKDSVNRCQMFYMDRLSKGLLDLAESAKNDKAILIFDLGNISTKYFKEDLIRKAIKLADIIQIPKNNYKILKESLNLNSFQELNPNIKIWIITNGNKPIKAYHINIGEIEVEVPKIKSFLDSGGAGDAFMAILLKQIYDYFFQHGTLKKMDKQSFLHIIHLCIENAQKSCLFIGARTYIYEYLNNKNKYSSLNDFLTNYGYEGDNFEKSINLIENFGKKLQFIIDENLFNNFNRNNVLMKKGKGVFENNLLNIPQVVNFALKNYEKYQKSVEIKDFGRNLIVIGSGASYSVAKAIQKLFYPPNQKFSVFAYTPFEYILKIQENYPICIISYSGTNPDVKSCFQKAIDVNSNYIILLTGNTNSLLAEKIKNSKKGLLIPVITPKEEKGFVGVFSMITALCILAKLLYKEEWKNSYTEFISKKNLEHLIEKYMKRMHNDFQQKIKKIKSRDKFHIVALGTNWSEPALIDLESKIIECNLGTIEISELKNYTHGRYINLYKNPANRLIVLFKTPETKKLVEFLYQKLSKVAPVFSLEAKSDNFIGLVDLFIQMLVFINQLGKFYKQDPSKPGFPNEAKGLYNWNGLYQ